MTSTIFLSISRFISIFASVLFCKESFEIVIKISSHPEHVHTSMPPGWLPLPFDSRLQRSKLLHDPHKTNVSLTHGYRTTVANTRFLQTGNPMSSSIPIHINLTTSINMRLTHGSRTTVANTRFHKKAWLMRKAVRKWLLAFLSNPIQSKKILIVVVRQQFVIGINCSIFLYRNSFGANQRSALTRTSFRIAQVLHCAVQRV